MLKETLYLIKHNKCSDNSYLKFSKNQNNNEENIEESNEALYQGFSAEIGAF